MKPLKPTLLALVLVLALTPAAFGGSQPTLNIPRMQLQSVLQPSLEPVGGPWLYWSDEDTTAIAAHRTHGRHPFLRLNELRPGDSVRLGAVRYTVRRSLVVPARATWILNYRGLVLSACSRADGTPTSAAYRMVVFAAPVR